MKFHPHLIEPTLSHFELKSTCKIRHPCPFYVPLDQNHYLGISDNSGFLQFLPKAILHYVWQRAIIKLTANGGLKPLP